MEKDDKSVIDAEADCVSTTTTCGTRVRTSTLRTSGVTVLCIFRVVVRVVDTRVGEDTLLARDARLVCAGVVVTRGVVRNKFLVQCFSSVHVCVVDLALLFSVHVLPCEHV